MSGPNPVMYGAKTIPFEVFDKQGLRWAANPDLSGFPVNTGGTPIYKLATWEQERLKAYGTLRELGGIEENAAMLDRHV